MSASPAPLPLRPSGSSLTLASSERPGTVLRLLEAARKNVVLYLPGHPQAVQSLSELHTGLTTVLKSRPSVRFDLYEDAFFWGNRILLDESLHTAALLDEFSTHHIGSVEFLQGIPLAETTSFVEVLAAAASGQADLTTSLAKASLTHIKLGPPRALDSDVRKVTDIPPRELFRLGLRTLDALNYQAVRGAPLNLRNARLLVNSMVGVILQDHYALVGVAGLYQHDEDTCHHSVDVAVLSLMLGLRLGLDERALAALGTAALLHDIGKMRIPRGMLGKSGPFTATERSVLERHTVHGAGMVQHLRGPSQTAMLVALEHHLNYNVSGYPRLPWAKKPHLFSRVVAIADFFDASVSARRTSPRPMLPDQAMHALVTGAGTQFDPTLAKLFLDTVGGYPVGSVVRLASGETAVVSRPTEGKPLSPQLKIVRDAQGSVVDPVLVELPDDARRIVHSLDPRRVNVDPAGYL